MQNTFHHIGGVHALNSETTPRLQGIDNWSDYERSNDEKSIEMKSIFGNSTIRAMLTLQSLYVMDCLLLNRRRMKTHPTNLAVTQQTHTECNQIESTLIDLGRAHTMKQRERE